MKESPFNYFRGDEYPSHFRFKREFEDGEIPEGTIIGRNHDILPEKPEIPSQILVWTQGQVVAMTTKRYREVFSTPKKP